MNHRALPALVASLVVIAACDSSADSSDDGAAPATSAEAPAADASTVSTPTGVETVPAPDAAAIIESDPDDLVVLDVRTPEEYAAGHLEGATLIDFYEPGFAEQIAALDPGVPYVVYCRSGNRSGETTALMDELGFASVADVDGGILAWDAAGLPVVTD
jgi:rhodanese-related sulfurtransferase